jgi:hypothetical protein
VDQRPLSERFPRASRYHPDWVLAGVSGGATPLRLTARLAEAMDLLPDMRVLDLGCGRALSAVFLRREFGVEVWATDLWFNAEENAQRVRDAFTYFGTDDLYLNYLARFLEPGGQIGIALAGFLSEIGEPIPPHRARWWAEERSVSLHSADWWRRHWERTGILDVEMADALPDGWHLWRDWLKLVAPTNAEEIRAVQADAGRHCGYVRAVGRRLLDPLPSWPAAYTKHPLLRGGTR